VTSTTCDLPSCPSTSLVYVTVRRPGQRVPEHGQLCREHALQAQALGWLVDRVTLRPLPPPDKPRPAPLPDPRNPPPVVTAAPPTRAQRLRSHGNPSRPPPDGYDSWNHWVLELLYTRGLTAIYDIRRQAGKGAPERMTTTCVDGGFAARVGYALELTPLGRQRVEALRERR
jgi:hypothetical protein